MSSYAKSRKNKKKSSGNGIDDEKKEATTQSLKSKSVSLKSSNYKKSAGERIFYLTKETIKELETNPALLVKLKSNFEAVNASIDFVNPTIVVQKGKLDNERILKMVQEVIKLAFSEAEFARLVEELASIEHPRNELLADPGKTFSDFLKKTEKGAMFATHSTHKKRNQWFCIKDDRLYWRDKEKGKTQLNRSMEMNSIQKIRPGKNSKIFKAKSKSKIVDDHCFSIIGVRKTLDLECKNRLIRDEWFTYLEFLHRHYCRAKRDTLYLNDLDNPLDDDLEDID